MSYNCQDVHLQNNLEAGLDLDLGTGDCGAKVGYRGAGARVNIGDIDEMVSSLEQLDNLTLYIAPCTPMGLCPWQLQRQK